MKNGSSRGMSVFNSEGTNCTVLLGLENKLSERKTKMLKT